jgi:hypothetical protein
VRCQHLSERAAEKVRVYRLEVRVIEYVESLDAELESG